MNYRFVDLPVFHSIQAYQDAIGGMVRTLSEIQAVKSIYQIGGVSTPGISDIDLYVVFHNGSTYTGNPVKELSGIPRYLFTHNLFGTSEQYALQMEHFTLFGAYHIVHGTELNMKGNALPESDAALIDNQVALEYLAKAYLSISASTMAGIIKTRNLLLHAKALLLDLKLLNVKSGNLYDTLHRIVEIRNNWFSDSKGISSLDKLVPVYKKGLNEVLTDQIQNHGFFVGKDTNLNVAKNMWLRNGNKVEIHNSGMRFPGFLNARFSKIHSLTKKFSQVEMYLPFTTTGLPSIIEKRLFLFREAEQHNKNAFPGFLPTAYGLHIFKSLN